MLKYLLPYQAASGISLNYDSLLSVCVDILPLHSFTCLMYCGREQCETLRDGVFLHKHPLESANI